MKIKCCPSCGSQAVGRAKVLRRPMRAVWDILPHRWFLECSDCFWRSEERLFLFRAERAWNKAIPHLDFTGTVTIDLPDIVIDAETVRRNLN